jgi:hypothetical protein
MSWSPWPFSLLRLDSAVQFYWLASASAHQWDGRTADIPETNNFHQISNATRHALSKYSVRFSYLYQAKPMAYKCVCVCALGWNVGGRSANVHEWKDIREMGMWHPETSYSATKPTLQPTPSAPKASCLPIQEGKRMLLASSTSAITAPALKILIFFFKLLGTLGLPTGTDKGVTALSLPLAPALPRGWAFDIRLKARQ